MKLDRMLSMSLMANALLGALAVAQAEPVSSVMRNGAKWSAKTWTSRDLWDYHTYAKDGGEATLLHGSFGIDDDGRVNKLDMNVNGLTLSGLMIKEMTSPFYSANGYSINMCGALPYIGRNATSEFQIELPLVGDGTNILRKTGPGLIRFDAPVQNFGASTSPARRTGQVRLHCLRRIARDDGGRNSPMPRFGARDGRERIHRDGRDALPRAGRHRRDRQRERHRQAWRHREAARFRTCL